MGKKVLTLSSFFYINCMGPSWAGRTCNMFRGPAHNYGPPKIYSDQTFWVQFGSFYLTRPKMQNNCSLCVSYFPSIRPTKHALICLVKVCNGLLYYRSLSPTNVAQCITTVQNYDEISCQLSFQYWVSKWDPHYLSWTRKGPIKPLFFHSDDFGPTFGPILSQFTDPSQSQKLLICILPPYLLIFFKL